jgi:hypothetical protein
MINKDGIEISKIAVPNVKNKSRRLKVQSSLNVSDDISQKDLPNTNLKFEIVTSIFI